MDVKYDGVIRISNDDKSIKSISSGGYLKISVRTFGNSRELLINSNSGGRAIYTGDVELKEALEAVGA